MASVLLGVAAVLGGCVPAIPVELTPSSDTASDPGASEFVATWRDGSITRAQVEERVADELRRMRIAYEVERHDLLHRTLEGMLEEQLLADAATRRGHGSIGEMLTEEIDARIEAPDEATLQRAFAQFRTDVPTATYEASRPYLIGELRRRAAEARREAFQDQLREELGVSVHLPFPDIPRVQVEQDRWDPTVGPDDALVTIVEFGGYQCYYCKRVHRTLMEVLERWPDDVRLVFKDFPLAGHEASHHVAYAAHCAAQQGRWAEMAERLLENQGRLDAARVHGLAEGLDLEPDAWDACMHDPSWGARIDQDVAAGRAAGVTSTPTFFVNGLMVVGALDRRRFHDVVAQEVARAKGRSAP